MTLPLKKVVSSHMSCACPCGSLDKEDVIFKLGDSVRGGGRGR